MDRATIESLFRTYGPLVLRRARLLLRDEQAAQDALQEVFVRALRAGRDFRAEASPTTWLYRITTNYCLNLRRDSARRDHLLRVRAPAREPAEVNIEDRRAVLDLLDRVPADTGTVAVLYFIDEMKQEEIAAHLRVSRRYVRDRLDAFRATAQRVMSEPEVAS